MTGRGYQDRMFDMPRAGQAANSGAWIDRKTGERIRVLGPGENFTDANAAPSYSFGDAVRGLTLGARGENELRAVQDSTIGGGGAMLPAPLASGLIDAMRAQSVVIALGGRSVEMVSKSLDMARIGRKTPFRSGAKKIATLRTLP